MFGAPFHPNRILRTFFRNDVRKRFQILAKEILTLEPDILFLQEVHDFPNYFYLRRLLAAYLYVSCKYSLYGPRGGLVIFSKLPLEKSYYHDFLNKGKVYNKSITGLLSQKGILMAKIQKTNLWLFNTHLTQNSDHNWSVENRFTPILLSQLQQVIVHTRTIVKRGESVIIAGDFNMPKDTPFYRDFIKQSGMKDIFAKDFFSTYHQSFLPQGASVGRVDYMFCSPEISVKKTSYILQQPSKNERGEYVYASDHIGLVATCRIRNIL